MLGVGPATGGLVGHLQAGVIGLAEGIVLDTNPQDPLGRLLPIPQALCGHFGITC